MDNSSYRDLYIEKLLNGNAHSEASARTVQNFWMRLHRFEQKYQKTLEQGYTKDEFIRMISDLKTSNIQGFLADKSRIKKYLEFLLEYGIVNEDNIELLVSIKYDDIDTSQVYEANFFKNFQELQNAIDATLDAADRIDDAIFATQIAAIYMAWCGVQLEDAIAMLKSDVKDDHIVVGNKNIYPNQKIMSFLTEYKDATEYRSSARGIITLKYVESSYLLRTVRSARIEEPKVMRIFIRNFGKSDPDQDANLFHYDKVYLSGIYHRAYLYECANGTIRQGDMETISKVFNEKYINVSVANKRLQSYRKFVDYFFPTR